MKAIEKRRNRGWYAGAAALVSVLALPALAAIGCGGAASQPPMVGGESHFLERCDSRCGGGLDCIGGVCTQSCLVSAQASCNAFPGAACTAESVEPGAVAVCDVACENDAACGALGSAHRCEAGYCRAPIRANGGTGGAPASPGPGAAGAGSSAGAAGTASSGPGSSACCPGVAVTWGGGQLSASCELAPRPADCTAPLPACGDPFRADLGDLTSALQQPDVLAAVAQGEVFLGYFSPVADPGPPITIGDSRLWLGSDCEDSPTPDDCQPIPPGIQALSELLRTLTVQRLTSGDCAADPRCYAPVDATASCSALLPRFAYDVARGGCIEVPEGTGCSSSNLFGSLEECSASCQGRDPCFYGNTILPATGPASDCVVAAGRCFHNSQLACLCACAVSGAPLSACGVDESAPAFASCQP